MASAVARVTNAPRPIASSEIQLEARMPIVTIEARPTQRAGRAKPAKRVTSVGVSAMSAPAMSW